MMIPQSEKLALLALILRLEEADALSELERFYMTRRRKFRRQRPNEDRDAFNEEFARLRAKWPIKSTYKPRDKNHPIHGDTHFALGYHVQNMNDELDDWFTVAADYPPQGSEGRIKAILKRAKEHDLRNRFCIAYAKHFGNFWKSALDRSPTNDDGLTILQDKVPRLKIAVIEIEELGDKKFNYKFEFHCRDCGGYEFNRPDGDDDDGPVLCIACQQVFGTFADMKALAQHVGGRELLRRGLLK